MITDRQYVVLSLELHMFFARIMKEHALFLKAGFTPVNANFSEVADQYKQQFETILYNAVVLGNGVISPTVAASGEIVTDYTLGSEQKTQNFTGIVIDKEITKLESNLYGEINPQITPTLINQVSQLNESTMPILDGLIEFKRAVLNNVLSCYMFITNYSLNIEHIIHEAEMYRSHLDALENHQNPEHSMKGTELFWDNIMMEHAEFIRGLLDPTEKNLIFTANNFAVEYQALLDATKAASDMTIGNVTETTIQKTVEFRDFKEAGTKGINECKIRSIILPLLADHVLREANHYIRLLKQLG